MPIAPLAESATRVLVSSIVLYDATSVVKELVENALDARATNIVIEIHANTLDIIQVKDNGRGIGIEDRQLLCKRGCTSKIRTFEDLSHLGGTSLGFRGEALASVAELSSVVTITTRVDGEVVGTNLDFEPSGKLRSSSSASHPVGTTVRVQDFLQNIPVRRQSTIKSSTKILNNIKKLLQAYALARPEVRLSFKVIKGKGNTNWTYAPSTSPNDLSDTAIKVVGKEVASLCELRTLSSVQEEGSSDTGYHIRALLLSSGQEISSAGGLGQYISIDRRPVNTDRGNIKEAMKLYKGYLKNGSNQQSSSMPSSPFLCMHITCPPDSYDVNINPAKDEVMFENPKPLLDLVERIFKELYGILSTEVNNDKAQTAPQGLHPTTGFDLLLARKRTTQRTTPHVPNTASDQRKAWPIEQSLHPNLAADVHQTEVRPTLRQESPNPYPSTRHHVNMASVDENDFLEDATTPDNAEDIENEEETTGPDISLNPWTIAKVNAVIPLQKSTLLNHTGTTGARDSSSVIVASDDSSLESPASSPNQLPTPGVSPQAVVPYQNPGPPLRPWRARAQEASGDSRTEAQTASTPSRSSMLEGWVERSQPVRTSQDRSPNRTQSTLASEDTDSQSSMVAAALQYTRENPPGSSPASLQAPVTRPFRSPFKGRGGSPRKVQTHAGRSDYVPTPTRVTSFLPHGHDNTNAASEIAIGTASSTRSSTSETGLVGRQPQQPNAELVQILDFERRKKETILQERKAALARSAHLAQTTLRSHPDNPVTITQGLQTVSPSQPDSSFTSPQEYAAQFSTPRPTSENRFGTPRSNPHRNRYLAALRTLNPQPNQQSQDSPSTLPSPADNPLVTQPLEPPTTSERSSSDPRIQLISQQRDAAHGLTRTGLKPKRTKSLRLPLEFIAPEVATYDLSATLPNPSVRVIRTAAEIMGEVDEYVKTGRVGYFTDNKDLLSDAEVVQRWEERLLRLLKERVKRQSGDVEVLDDFQIDVKTALEEVR